MKFNRMLTGITAAAMALVAGPALATGTSHTVSVGGTPLTTSTTFSASTFTAGIGVVFTSGLTCSSATASGTVQPGIDIATLTTSTWTGCTGPGAAAYTVTRVGSWPFHSSTAGTASATEVIPGHVENIELVWQHAVSPNVCKFVIRGTGATKGLANASFNESTQQLAISETGLTGNLRVQSVSGCGGALQSGNAVNLSMTMAVTAAGGALNVTS